MRERRSAVAPTPGESSWLGVAGAIGAGLGLLVCGLWLLMGLKVMSIELLALGAALAAGSILAFAGKRLPCALASGTHVLVGTACWSVPSRPESFLDFSEFFHVAGTVHFAAGVLMLAGALRLRHASPRHDPKPGPDALEEIFR